MIPLLEHDTFTLILFIKIPRIFFPYIEETEKVESTITFRIEYDWQFHRSHPSLILARALFNLCLKSFKLNFPLIRSYSIKFENHFLIKCDIQVFLYISIFLNMITHNIFCFESYSEYFYLLKIRSHIIFIYF